jgi:hypothetical protein
MDGIQKPKSGCEKMGELIYSETGFRLYRSIWGDSIELEGVFKPLEDQGFGGNKERFIITLYLDGSVEVNRIRENWNGTGADTIAHCTLDQNEADQLRNKIEQAKNLSDFKALLNHLLATC